MNPPEPGAGPLDVGGLRVLQVVASTVGGTGAHVRMLVERLVDLGAVVTVAGPAAVHETFRFASTGARFVVVPIGDHPQLRDGATLLRLRQWGRSADIVHAHGLRAAALAGLAVPRAVPIVVTRHNAILVTGRTRAVHERLQRYTARRADVTMCVSGDLLTAVRAAGGTNVRRTFVTAPAMPPATRDPAVVRGMLAGSDRPLVLSVGRLHEQKDYPTLIEAARRLADMDPIPLVAIAGEGPRRAELQALVDRTGAPVRLLGERRDVQDLLRAADALVLTSVWEAGSLAVQEGLRVGVPFVGTRVGALPDLVADAGLLVPAGDPHALAVQLRRVLTEPELAADLRARALRRSAALPTDADVVEQVLSAYAEAAGADRQAGHAP